MNPWTPRQFTQKHPKTIRLPKRTAISSRHDGWLNPLARGEGGEFHTVAEVWSVDPERALGGAVKWKITWREFQGQAVDCFCAACSFPRPGQSCALPYHLKKHYTIEHLTSRFQENRLSLSLSLYNRKISLDITKKNHYTIEHQYENLPRRGGAGFPMAEERHPTARPGHEANRTWQSPNTWRFQWENHGKIMGKYGKIIEHPSFMEDFPMNTEHLHF